MSNEASLVGAEIRKVRLARGWSLSKLAEEADLSATYMGAVERGAKSPTVTTLAKISRALLVDLSLILAPLNLGAPDRVTKEEFLCLLREYCRDSYSREQVTRILAMVANPGEGPREPR